jgi:hypothetical protein
VTRPLQLAFEVPAANENGTLAAVLRAHADTLSWNQARKAQFNIIKC